MGLFLMLACMASTSLADEETLVTGAVRSDLKVRAKPVKAIEGDPKCACLHDKLPVYEDLLIGADGGVKWAIVRVTKGLEGRTFDAPKTPALIDQKGCCYSPYVTGVQTGQPVEFKNSDGFLHNVHGLPFDNKEFNFGQQRGAIEEKRFPKPEIFKVKCDVHPWMSAWIGVFDHPYFAITDAEGRFTIKNLPPGKYTLEVWHEKLKGPSLDLTVEGKETRAPAFTLVEK
jgi:plastocyanin